MPDPSCHTARRIYGGTDPNTKRKRWTTHSRRCVHANALHSRTPKLCFVWPLSFHLYPSLITYTTRSSLFAFIPFQPKHTHTRIWPYIARTYINVKKGGSFRSSSTNLLAIARAFAFLLASYRLRERSKNLSFWCVCLRASSCFRCLGERDRDGHEQWLAWLLLVFFLGEGLWRRLW